MRRAFFYARRTVAVILVIIVVLFAIGFVLAARQDPLGGGLLILMLGLVGGFVFLVWATFKMIGGVVRFVAGPPRRQESRGLGADYEDMIQAQTSRRWRRKRR